MNRKERIWEKLRTVMSEEDMNRLWFSELSKEKFKITADVHGMKRFEAKRFLRNIIALIREAFFLMVIHGYNRGTVLKELTRNMLDNAYRVSGFEGVQGNLGCTILDIATAQ